MADTWCLLGLRLIRSGVAPKDAYRYLTELRDHEADLIAEAQHCGHGFKEAKREARGRLGDLDTLYESCLCLGRTRRHFRRLAELSFLVRMAWSPNTADDLSAEYPQTLGLLRWGTSAALGGMVTLSLLFALQAVVPRL